MEGNKAISSFIHWWHNVQFTGWHYRALFRQQLYSDSRAGKSWVIEMLCVRVMARVNCNCLLEGLFKLITLSWPSKHPFLWDNPSRLSILIVSLSRYGHKGWAAKALGAPHLGWCLRCRIICHCHAFYSPYFNSTDWPPGADTTALQQSDGTIFSSSSSSKHCPTLAFPASNHSWLCQDGNKTAMRMLSRFVVVVCFLRFPWLWLFPCFNNVIIMSATISSLIPEHLMGGPQVLHLILLMQNEYLSSVLCVLWSVLNLLGLVWI